MIRLLLIALVVIAACLGAPARAQLGIGSPTATCPMGYSLGDFCPPAPQGQFILPNLLSTAPVSGQTYMPRSSWPYNPNIPAIDYRIANITPVAQMNDPATATFPGNWCVYSATGSSTGAPKLACTMTTPGAYYPLSQINFGPVGGHGCTVLELKGEPPLAQFDLFDNYFKNDANCAGLGGWLFSEDFQNGVYYTTIRSNMFDGQGLVSPWPHGTNYASGAFAVGGCITAEYNAIINFTSRPTSIVGYPNCQINYIANYFSGWCIRYGGCHSELDVESSVGSLGAANFLHNLVEFTPYQIGTTYTFIVNLAAALPINGNLNFSGNTVLSNNLGGGQPGQVTGYIGNADTSPSAILTLTSVSAGTIVGPDVGIGYQVVITGFQDDGSGGGVPSGIAGTVLTVTTPTPSQYIGIGWGLYGVGVTQPAITSQISGAPGGGAGAQYQLSGGALNVGPTTLYLQGMAFIGSYIDGQVGTAGGGSTPSHWYVDEDRTLAPNYFGDIPVGSGQQWAGEYAVLTNFATSSEISEVALTTLNSPVGGIFIGLNNQIDMQGQVAVFQYVGAANPCGFTNNISGNFDIRSSGAGGALPWTYANMNEWSGLPCP
jgi:hypothetical protein